jgi:hypothetical protein
MAGVRGQDKTPGDFAGQPELDLLTGQPARHRPVRPPDRGGHVARIREMRTYAQVVCHEHGKG